MPDDPKKRGKQDRSRVSKQPHEQQYQKRKNARTHAAPARSTATRRSGSR
jgi:hypothetical protein